jgi:exodeoxyribonuclease VII small subunit
VASFEEHLKALESVVQRLESGDLSLEESVRLFEEGMKLSDACKKELDAAEDRGRGGMKAVDLDLVDGAQDTGDGE